MASRGVLFAMASTPAGAPRAAYRMNRLRSPLIASGATRSCT
jgi:hypothetical protein